MKDFKLLFDREQIHSVVLRLSEEIKRDYNDHYPLLIGVLKGAFIFMADLVRVLNIPLGVEFVKLSSYSKNESSGKVRVVQGLNSSIRNRDVLIIEDIVDTGLTVKFLQNYLLKGDPRSLRLCSLLVKPSRCPADIVIDYKGVEIPDLFVVGYGLDYSEGLRYLPEIYYSSRGEDVVE